MKRKFFSFLTVALCVGLLFSACKKSDSKDDSTTDVQIATQSDDESMISKESDGVIADANLLLEADVNFSGDYAVLSPGICDATVVFNRDSDPMTMTITYNGETCDSTHVRTGVAVVSMAKDAAWKTAGASITIDFQSVKIVRTSDNKTVTLTGTQTYTNVSGGLLYQLASVGPITHTVTSSNMSISFDNGTARTWNIARKSVYSYDGGVAITETGTHSEGDLTGIAEWGTNRFEKTFTTAISSPLVFKEECSFRLTSGAVVHATSAYTATVTFGLDASGAATSCPGSGHYYYNLDWTRTNGNHLSIVLPY